MLEERLILTPALSLRKGHNDFVVYMDAMGVGFSCILMKRNKVIAKGA